MTERELQDAVCELARLLGYLAHHPLPARTNRGWRTPLQGDPGAPDLLLVGRGRVIHAELKSERGKLSNTQVCWRDALIRAGAEYHEWRPTQWVDGTVERVLRDGTGHDTVLGRLARSAA